VAYLVVGPEIRGKFDAAAADALGVLKRDRGKLTKGESVTVTVNGAQSVVTPDMCIGKSEAPTVGCIFMKMIYINHLNRLTIGVFNNRLSEHRIHF
jgi:hypothetical protein